jgi:protein phosphatase
MTKRIGPVTGLRGPLLLHSTDDVPPDNRWNLGVAGNLPVGARVIDRALDRGGDVSELRARYAERKALVGGYVDTYRRYSWRVRLLADFRLAPFYLLATEGRVHCDKGHLWHMQSLKTVCRSATPALFTTRHRTVPPPPREHQ